MMPTALRCAMAWSMTEFSRSPRPGGTAAVMAFWISLSSAWLFASTNAAAANATMSSGTSARIEKNVIAAA